jgi:hypothetical protein
MQIKISRSKMHDGVTANQIVLTEAFTPIFKRWKIEYQIANFLENNLQEIAINLQVIK